MFSYFDRFRFWRQTDENTPQRTFRCGHITKADAVHLGIIFVTMLGVSLLVMLNGSDQSSEQSSSEDASVSLRLLHQAQASLVPLAGAGAVVALAKFAYSRSQSIEFSHEKPAIANQV